MSDELFEWLELVLGDRYLQSAGQWIDAPENYGAFIVAVYGTGGPPTDVDLQLPTYRVLLLGPRNGRGHHDQIKTDIHALVRLAISGATPCGAAGIRAISQPVGPGYTSENRPWYSVEFQITY